MSKEQRALRPKPELPDYLRCVEKDLPGYDVSPWTGKPTVWNPRQPCPSCGSPLNAYGVRAHCWGWMYYQEPCFAAGTFDLPVEWTLVRVVRLLLLSESAS